MSDTTTLKKYWNRSGWIEIENDAGNMVAYAGRCDLAHASVVFDKAKTLDFKFSGTKAGDIYGRFEVGILGLSTPTIQNLTTWNVAEAVKRRRRIKVYAGYEVDNLQSPIFDGFIMEAMPTNPPEMWMNFKCMKYYESNQPIYEWEQGEKTLAQIVGKIASLCNVGWSEENWKATSVSKDKKVGYLYIGTKTQLIQAFAKRFGVLCYEKNGNLFVENKRPWLYNPDDAELLTPTNGMLGIGNITMKGATVTRRLDDTLGLCEWVNIKSNLIPSANAKYIVIRKTHKGHFRGNEWNTELECVRYGAQV